MHLIAVFTLIFIHQIRSQKDIEATDYEEEAKALRGYLLKKFMQSIPEIIERWVKYKILRRLQLTSEDNRKTFFVYAKNVMFIEEFMAKKDRTFDVGENDFTYFAREKYFKSFGLTTPYSETPGPQPSEEETTGFTKQSIPVYKDWRKLGHVNKVKNQGGCGSCYAFSTVATVESHLSIKYGKGMETLSEQSIVDCSGPYGTYNCNGGNYQSAFSYLKDYPLPPSSNYSYTAKFGRCRISMDPSKARVKDFKSIFRLSDDKLALTVSKEGPLGIAFDARDPAFQHYIKGIYKSTVCTKTQLNHAMTLVGVGSSPAPHFIVRNSYSESYGEGGYILVEKKSNTCGITNYAYYPIV